MKNIEPVKRKKKAIKPIVVTEISSEKPVFFQKKEKVEVKQGPPAGHVRVVVLKDCDGMTGSYYTGDILDLPERRFKSMSFRGLVKLYEGDKQPNRQR